MMQDGATRKPERSRALVFHRMPFCAGNRRVKIRDRCLVGACECSSRCTQTNPTVMVVASARTRSRARGARGRVAQQRKAVVAAVTNVSWQNVLQSLYSVDRA